MTVAALFAEEMKSCFDEVSPHCFTCPLRVMDALRIINSRGIGRIGRSICHSGMLLASLMLLAVLHPRDETEKRVWARRRAI